MARKFEFRLEAVERVRRRARDAQRRAVARSLGELNAVDAVIAGYQHELGLTLDLARACQAAVHLPMAQLRDQHLYRGWLRRRIDDTGEERKRRLGALRAAQAALAEASKQLRVIEQLRERQWAAHAAALAKAEQLAVDEAALQGHRRATTEATSGE
jgi:flagellar export protein FliJ